MALYWRERSKRQQAERRWHRLDAEIIANDGRVVTANRMVADWSPTDGEADRFWFYRSAIRNGTFKSGTVHLGSRSTVDDSSFVRDPERPVPSMMVEYAEDVAVTSCSFFGGEAGVSLGGGQSPDTGQHLGSP